jgi:hypothetical protein
MGAGAGGNGKVVAVGVAAGRTVNAAAATGVTAAAAG